MKLGYTQRDGEQRSMDDNTQYSSYLISHSDGMSERSYETPDINIPEATIQGPPMYTSVVDVAASTRQPFTFNNNAVSVPISRIQSDCSSFVISSGKNTSTSSSYCACLSGYHR